MVIPIPYSPYLFTIGLFSVRWYGFLIALAVAISYLLSLREAKKQGIDESKFDTIFLITVISGIIGARIGFIVQNVHYFSKHLLEMASFWSGGLSIHGAIILGSTALFLSSKKYKIKFLEFANIISPYLMLSGAIGRWGNYFNQEIIGKPSNSFIKMAISLPNRLPGLEKYEFFHPVFLYESVLLFCGFVIYFIFKNKLKNYALVYTLVIYSLIRIVVEFWRVDYKPILFSLDLAQWVSFGIIVITIIFWILSRRILTYGKN